MDIKSIEEMLQSNVDPNFKFIDNREKEVPFVKLGKPISEAKVALISSGGLHLKDDPKFDTEDSMGDASYREIPSRVKFKDLEISHGHYDYKYIKEDINTVFPVELLQRLEERGVIGALARRNYSFMGYCLKVDELINQTGMKIANSLKEDQVDIAILAPA
ncbi:MULTISPECIES: glycine/sarcosine/betaine reductase selenoprotein B family protein [unclassified Candidatus Frackibacter]|uniref:glycine/sarcosine/betaine reductase selenoprotein B family protein n=1 Tax=unclassified Candidatus Frackibacter TaxID=2648818 RepID=UPI0007984654|nr:MULTISPECIES: glycine/sarcosine/betaine reductase selenoprotein B family protein [unclassified Candidatus Frackibacter]KXS42554.1 MAG: D-proline reductase [Candidatus Frackibacter sp. T328-2]SDC69064.1 selenoprotein B, glycine/betaine/sarcosine/D-proline reductase family [Candidatus Frackibacter sp. WG11]SEM82675.1 selenoprotein B, glycine/betaine/sarcosine/D-proline reductase family [Candidatus Frackibacter sp. WG12]SFL92664.1 selenoprotein B, glycine/betaine/sarcosine/D-proline reductase f